jgi:ABC-type lipoprotein export system ATPase subunit
MIILNELYIKGFKELEREIHLTFSKEPITVLYGENGSGKTTLLQILHALLVQDYQVFSERNVQELQLNYSFDGQNKKISFQAARQKFDDDTNEAFFNKTQSILAMSSLNNSPMMDYM